MPLRCGAYVHQDLKTCWRVRPIDIGAGCCSNAASSPLYFYSQKQTSILDLDSLENSIIRRKVRCATQPFESLLHQNWRCKKQLMDAMGLLVGPRPILILRVGFNLTYEQQNAFLSIIGTKCDLQQDLYF